MLKRLFSSMLFVSVLFAQGGPGQSNYPVSQITLQNNGTSAGSVNGNVTVNYVSGCTTSVSGSVASITCTGSGGSGTVTSVTVTGDGIFDSATPSSAVTTSGTLTLAVIAQTGNCVFASPSGGGSGNPSCRSLVLADLPAAYSGAPAAGTVLNGTSTTAASFTQTPTFGNVGGTSGSLTLAGSTSGSGTFSCAAAACTNLSLNIGFNANANLAIGGHLNQTATGKYAGSCSMSTSTTCTFSIATTFTSYLSFVSVDHASVGSLTVANSCGASLASTTVTITCAVSNSLTWDALLIGNPS